MASSGDKKGRQYDLVVFGVTGYTGKYVAEEIYRLQVDGKQSLKWAVAGRSEDKVQETLTELGIEDVDIIVADVSDQDSIEAMCGRTRVIVDVVGPYILYGEPVIKACINQHCDYVDITGEPLYIETMIARYGEAAKEAGIYIVNCCGFDSIPCDIGALVLHKAFNGQLAYIESYMYPKANTVNTGTWNSLVHGIGNQKKLQEFRKRNPVSRPKLPDVHVPKRCCLFYSDVAHGWCVPFTGSDRHCMLSSAQYRNEKEDTPMFRVNLYMKLGPFLRAMGVVLAFLLMIIPLALTNFGTKLLIKYPSLFTLGVVRKGGPTRSEVEKGTFTIILDGAGYSQDNTDKIKPDAFLRVRVRGAEPGYVATSAMMVQSALCLINERANLPDEGGIYAPGAAFGKTNIVHNLELTGKVKFAVEQI